MASLDKSLFNQLFADFDSQSERLQSGLLSLDQKEVSEDEVHNLQTLAPSQATWFKAEVEPSVGTCLFLDVVK